MKTKFSKTQCQHCNQEYDSALLECPECHSLNSDETVRRRWHEVTPLGPSKEIGVFCLGFLGLQIIEIIVELIVLFIERNSLISQGYSDSALNDALTNYLSTGDGLAAIFFPTYGIIFVLLLLLLWDKNLNLLAKFKQGKTYFGFLVCLAIIFFDLVYSNLIATFINGQSNQNQSNIVAIENAYPWLSLLIFGLVGPFVEEAAYRLGLFNFLKRISTFVAYIGTALFFGFIHFDWSNISSLVEWLNLPPYIFAGLALAFAYDKFGFGASYIAHATNNLFSCLILIIQQRS